MTITSRQFDQLSEMGISLWQSRNITSQDNEVSELYTSLNQQSLDEIAKKTIFSDILLSLILTIGEVSVQNNHHDVGMFNWYFIYDDTEQANRVDTDNIMYSESKLITPNIETIAQSAILKKQLWHTITKNLL